MLTRRVWIATAGAIGILVLASLLAIHGRSHAAAPLVAPEAAASEAPSIPAALEVSPQALGNMGLHYARAELRPLVRALRVSGTVGFDSQRLAQLSSPSRGRMEAIDAVVGQHVRAGQRLAILDDFDLSDVRSQVASAQAAVADAAATAATAQAALARATELVNIGGAAMSELEHRRAMAADAQASLQMHRAELKKWRDRAPGWAPTGRTGPDGAATALARMGPRDTLGAVVAPFDGVIISAGAAPGEIVDTSVRIFTVADVSTLWVQANVAEQDLSAVHVGDAVAISVDAYPGRQFNGRVIDIANQVDPNTGSVAVRCEVPNPDGALRANMFASVNIASALGRSGVLVPDSALQDVNGQSEVFVPSGARSFTRHAVRIGLSSGGFTEIEGLPAGTQVVTDGSYWLKAGFLQSAIPDEG
jgi:cobalt-zinc-cadmium efflux system membrane fusion protein